MRILAAWLATALLGAAPPSDLALPGCDPALLRRILGDSAEGRTPWKAFQLPPISASAVVEVVGYLTPEERREEAFQEFMAWFRQDLQRFLKAQGGGFPDPASHLTADRPGGNPMPRHATLLRIAF